MIGVKKEYVDKPEREYYEGYSDKLASVIRGHRATVAVRERWEMNEMEEKVYLHAHFLGREFTVKQLCLSIRLRFDISSQVMIGKAINRLVLKHLIRIKVPSSMNTVILESGKSVVRGRTGAIYEITRAGYNLLEEIIKEFDSVEAYDLKGAGKHLKSLKGKWNDDRGVKY